MKALCSSLAALLFLGWAIAASAQYLVVLKNGRQILVRSYREEKSMVLFQGFGGEIGLSKEQVQAIRKATVGPSDALDLTVREEPAVAQPAKPESVPEQPVAEAEDRARLEREYAQKLNAATERLKEAQDRYAQAVRGTTSPDPALLTTEEQLKARTDDIISRALDAQYDPSPPAEARIVTPSAFSSLPPTIVEVTPPTAAPRPTDTLPQYTPRQKELSELRRQILRLEQERERLLGQMREKKIGAASLIE